MSLIGLKMTPVHHLGFTTIQSTKIYQLLLLAWLLLICLYHAVSRWLSFQTKNIFPARCARSGSSLRLKLNFALASCQRGLQATIIAWKTGRSTGTLFKADTYITNSSSWYSITNSHFKRCIFTSLIGRIRRRPLKRHKGMEKQNLLMGLIWIQSLIPYTSLVNQKYIKYLIP